MKISKHLHSCLLIEEADKTVLIDPGLFTAQDKGLDVQALSKLDYLLITHEHPDHFHIPLIKEILAKFPETKIISNRSIVALLQKEGIMALSDPDENIELADEPHEELWDVKAPENSIFTVFHRLTDPGDSHHFIHTEEILALPITAPWGGTTAAVELALNLKPKVIIPVHDWFWKDEFRESMYDRLRTFFQTQDIDFKSPKTGEVFEV